MNFHIGQGDKFDISALMPFPRKINLFQRILIRLSFPFFLPRVIWSVMTTWQDRNPLNDGKRELSGRKIAATSSDIKFAEVKAASKALGVTINDMVSACLAAAVAQYFAE